MSVQLEYFGFGGGSDGGHIQDDTNSYVDQYMQCIRDICGPGGLVRVDVVATQVSTTTGAYTWSPGTDDRIMYYIAKYDLVPLIGIHYRATRADQRPVIDGSGVMSKWKQFCHSVANRYGPSGTFGDGTVVNGLTVSGWTPCTMYEMWNEPNAIGSCGGLLDSGNSTHNKYVFRINYDGSAGIREVSQANGWDGDAVVIGGVFGSIDKPYIEGVLGYGDIFGPNRCNAASVHIYQHTDPKTTDGGPRSITTLQWFRDTINANGADDTMGIWITEGLFSGSDRWNRFQRTFGGLTVSATSHAGKDPQWETPHTGEGNMEDYFHRALLMMKANNNKTNPWGIAGITPHVVFDEKTSPANGDYRYWQNTRGFSYRSVGGDGNGVYTDATGSPLSSPDWKNVASAYRDFIANETTPVAPDTPTILAGPAPSSITVGSVVFTWSDESADFYETNLNGAGWVSTTDRSKAYTGLADGTYTFQVRAVNDVGTSAAASVTWDVDALLGNAAAPTGSFEDLGDSSELPITLTINAFDADSVALVEVSWNDGTTWEEASPGLLADQWVISYDAIPLGTRTFIARVTDSHDFPLSAIVDSLTIYLTIAPPSAPAVIFETEGHIAIVMWKMILFDKHNDPIVTLEQAYDRTLHFELNGIDSCGFKVPLDWVGASSIEPLKTNVKVWRRIEDIVSGDEYQDPDDRPCFAGTVGPVTMNAGSNSLEVTAYAPLWKTQHRYHVDRHHFIEKDPSFIMMALLNFTQHGLRDTTADLLGIGGWTMIANPDNTFYENPYWSLYGSTADYGQNNLTGEGGSVAIDYASPRGKNTWQVIEDIITQQGMPDLVPLYVHFEGNKTNMFFNTAIVRGVRPDSAVCKFEYKTGMNNLDDMESSVNVEPGRFANYVAAQGQGDGDGFKVIYPKTFDTADRDVIDDYGLYMKWIKYDHVKRREHLRTYAKDNLKRSQYPITVYTPTLSPTVPPYYKLHFDLGDVVLLSAERGAMTFTDAPQRIYQIDLELTEGGFEKCTPTMARDFTDAVPE